MDKIRINGYDWIRLHDICDIFRSVQEDATRETKADTFDAIAHLMFYDERKAAKTDEEKEALLEFSGDFVVTRPIDLKKRKFEWFKEWVNGEAVLTTDSAEAMHFEYKSMAEGIAEHLGDGWKAVCLGVEDGKMTRRLLNALFDAMEDEKE